MSVGASCNAIRSSSRSEKFKKQRLVSNHKNWFFSVNQGAHWQEPTRFMGVREWSRKSLWFIDDQRFDQTARRTSRQNRNVSWQSVIWPSSSEHYFENFIFLNVSNFLETFNLCWSSFFIGTNAQTHCSTRSTCSTIDWKCEEFCFSWEIHR